MVSLLPTSSQIDRIHRRVFLTPRPGGSVGRERALIAAVAIEFRDAAQAGVDRWTALEILRSTFTDFPWSRCGCECEETVNAMQARLQDALCEEFFPSCTP